MHRLRVPLLVAAVGAAALVAVLAGPTRRASAHPLGNFTINHYDRIDVAETGIQVYRILDMAEIPAFQERQQIDRNGDGEVDDGESEAWAAAKADELRAHIVLAINGEPRELTDVSHTLSYPPGQGGLSLLRLAVTYRSELPSGWRDASPKIGFSDGNYDGRIGWREIVVRGALGVDITDSTAPTQDVSNELRSYPQDALSAPLDVRSATFSFKPGIGAVATPLDENSTRATRGSTDSTLSHYSDLIAKDRLSASAIALALLAAMGFGAIHALSPGHGKTIVAAYMVGSRGTAKHALLLGLTVTATHTSSVYALGFITLYLSAYIVPDTLYPWLGVASGAIILAMGLSLFVGRLRSSGLVGAAAARLRAAVPLPARPPLALALSERGAAVMGGARPAEDTSNGPRDAHAMLHASGAELDHAHEVPSAAHSHSWGPAHTHAIPGQDGEPVTWRRLVGLGIFGGLLPCPSAIVVMLSAIALHRVGLGLALIVAFSVGLAGVLTGIGFILVYARSIVNRVPLLGRLADGSGGGMLALAVRAFPVASAAAVVGAGLLVTLRAMAQQGIL